MAGPGLTQVQSLRQTQVMAPQMRQSLKMLQVPVLELQAIVAQELEVNPTLDETPLENEQIEIEPEVDAEAPDDRAEELELMEDYERLAKLDDEWRDYFNQASGSGGPSAEALSRREYLMNTLRQETSLQEHLAGQLAMVNLDDHSRRLGELLIGCIDEDGFLGTTVEELALTGFEAEDVERVLAIVQEFEPVGVAARDLRECLLIQLRRRGRADSLAYRVVEQHLHALGGRKYPDIASSLEATVDEVTEAARDIAALEPRPGREFSGESATYVLPELTITKDDDGEYIVLLNDDQIPNLRISRRYRQLVEDAATNKETRRYIIEKIKQGEFLIKSIQQRQDTIRAIAERIVEVQRDFLDHGVEHLRPLTMSEVADEIGKHETTVSRAIANKYVQTPRGVLELRYFFTPGYKKQNGSEVSNEAVKNNILKLVDEEDKLKPLSDSAIQKQLEANGTKVARRTIAKYREELKILPSHMRKSF